MRDSKFTVVYHITDFCCKRGHPMGKEIIKEMKRISQTPDVGFNPFVVLLTLSLASSRQFRSQFLDLVKAASIRCFVTKEKASREKRIAENCLLPIPDPVSAFDDIVNEANESQSRDLVERPAVDLAFMLIDASKPLGGKADLKTLSSWDTGIKMLDKVIKLPRHSRDTSAVFR